MMHPLLNNTSPWGACEPGGSKFHQRGTKFHPGDVQVTFPAYGAQELAMLLEQVSTPTLRHRTCDLLRTDDRLWHGAAENGP
jgi:hypothetical protein